MDDLIIKLKDTMLRKNLSPEDASKFINCSFKSVYRWLHNERRPTGLYRQAILKGIKKMQKLPSLNLVDLAKSDRELYRKLKEKITYQEKEWLLEHPEDYSIYRERLKELTRKHGIEKDN